MFLRCSVTLIPSGPIDRARRHFSVSARELSQRTEVAHAPPVAVQWIALPVSADPKQPKMWPELANQIAGMCRGGRHRCLMFQNAALLPRTPALSAADGVESSPARCV